MKINLEQIRSEIILDIMKKDKYKEGIKLADLYEEIFNHKDFAFAFSNANKNDPNQWKSSTRRLLQERSINMKSKKGSHEDFVSLGLGKYTYASNPDQNMMERVEIVNSVNKLIRDIDSLNLSSEEKFATIKVRMNQSKFRKHLLEEFKECPIRHINLNQLLIASHIVDYADCEDEGDRANPKNGLLLTSDMDKLFDSKLISFDHRDGRIIISNFIDDATLKKLNLSPNLSLSNYYLNDERKKYLSLRNNKYNLIKCI